MPRKRLGVALVTLFLAVATSSCTSSSGHVTLYTAPQLASKILPAPGGYVPDKTPNASGGITPTVFGRFGGAGSPNKIGFVAGFKQNYVDDSTGEGVIVTILEFKSFHDANRYATNTRTSTLKLAAATYKPYNQIPGATEADGTKAYNGGYLHAIFGAVRNFYFQVVYANALPSSAPVEFNLWAKVQWYILKQTT